MYSYEIVHYVAKLLEPLVRNPRSLPPSEAGTLRKLKAVVSMTWLVNFPKLDIYESDPRLGTILKVIKVFGVQCFSGPIWIPSVRVFGLHIRDLVSDFGTARIAEMIQKHPQAVDRCFYRDDVGIKMATLLSRAVGWPLSLGEMGPEFESQWPTLKIAVPNSARV